MPASIYKIPPNLPLPSGSETALSEPEAGSETKGRDTSPLWPPAHRASGPESKEG